MKSLHFLLGITCIASLTGCVSSAQVEPNSNLDRARQTLDSLYLNYSVDNSEKTIPSTNNIPSLIWHQKNRLIFPTNSLIYGRIREHSLQSMHCSKPHMIKSIRNY